MPRHTGRSSSLRIEIYWLFRWVQTGGDENVTELQRNHVVICNTMTYHSLPRLKTGEDFTVAVGLPANARPCSDVSAQEFFDFVGCEPELLPGEHFVLHVTVGKALPDSLGPVLEPCYLGWCQFISLPLRRQPPELEHMGRVDLNPLLSVDPSNVKIGPPGNLINRVTDRLVEILCTAPGTGVSILATGFTSSWSLRIEDFPRIGNGMPDLDTRDMTPETSDRFLFSHQVCQPSG